MHFHGITFLDTGFSFLDPQMACGAIYGYAWLLVGFLIIFSRFRNKRLFNLYAIAGCAFVGLWFPKSFAVAVLNLFAEHDTSIGMPFGGPPLWLAFVSIMAGALLGWVAQKCSEAEYKRSHACLLSMIFPGLGQVYRGKLILGFGMLIGLCFTTQMFGLIGLLAAYVTIQAAKWFQRPLGSGASQVQENIVDCSSNEGTK